MISASLTAAPVSADPATDDDQYKIEWLSTTEMVIKGIPSPEDDDDVTGFFDLYEYRPNKDSHSIQLGPTAFDLDIFGEEDTPLLQFRLRSPTSNLGISGEDIDQPFLNQRAELFARPEDQAILLDLQYRRMRTDELRLFPNPTGTPAACPAVAPPPECGIASRFNDDTSPDDRFFSQRTLVDGDVRLRPDQLFRREKDALSGWLPELFVRGGYEDWSGNRQLRYILGGSDRAGGEANDAIRWRALTQEIDQNVANAAGGLVLEPAGLFTLVLDVDHQRFRNDAPTILQSQVATFAPGDIRTDGTPGTLDDRGLRTFNFIPDTNRTTGTARLHARIGERAVVRGGFQAASLDQVEDRTPFQEIAGLRDNEIRFYSGNLVADLSLTERFSANGYFKADLRKNRIDRTTDLFRPDNDTQVDPFLERIRWITGGTELVYRFRRRNLVAAGWRGEWIDRKLSFATSEESIAPGQASIRGDTQTHTGYIRTVLRLVRGLHVSGEIGYRYSPETGYVREPEHDLYGNGRLSYTFPLDRPVVLSIFARGETYENDGFQLVGATTSPDRDFSRDNYSYGLSLTGSPFDRLTLFSSFFQYRDLQDFGLIRATDRRFEDPDGVDFYTDTPLDYRSTLTTVIFGGTFQIAERTDASLTYSYTRSDTRFQADTPTSSTIRSPSRIRSDIHGVETRVGRWVHDGLRVFVGYRFDRYLDHTDVPSGMGSVVAPFDLSTYQHTATIGITLTSDLFARN